METAKKILTCIISILASIASLILFGAFCYTVKLFFFIGWNFVRDFIGTLSWYGC